MDPGGGNVGMKEYRKEGKAQMSYLWTTLTHFLNFCLPSDTFPGLWEVPLVDYYDTKGKLCNFVVSCTPPASVDEVIKLFDSNFQKHYTTNRAPFLIPLEPKWLQNNMYFEG